MENQVVVFKIAEETYGIQITEVENIIKVQAIARLPHAPLYVEGVTELRGKILPVVNLHKRFGLLSPEIHDTGRIIVVNIADEKIGMIVDEVTEVLRIPENAIETSPQITTSVESEFISGIAKIDHQLVILLDLQKIFPQ